MLDEERESNPYLQQEVLAASPARMRWMLIVRAKELCEGVEALWSDGQLALGDQWSLRIREILGELLAGVTAGNPISEKVADFYLFLLKLLSESEVARNIERLRILRDLLAYEADTWQMVVQKSVSGAGEQPVTSPIAPKPHLLAPLSMSYEDDADFSTGGSFSLDV